MLKTYGIKQILSKKVFPILIIALIIVSFSKLNNLKLDDFNNRNIPGLNYSIGTIKGREMVERVMDGMKEDVKEYLTLVIKNAELSMESINSGNYIEAYRYEIIGRILDLIISKPDQREYIDPITIPIWEGINPEIEYPNYNMEEFAVSDTSDVVMKSELIKLKYLYNCYKLGIPYVEEYNANNIVFLYNIMDKMIPIFIILFVLLLAYDTVSEEHRQYISRNILSQPIKRTMYLSEKLISNITAIVPAIIITIILICMFATIYTDSHSFKMPILTTDNQWNRFTHNRMSGELSLFGIGELGPTSVENAILGENYLIK